MKPEVKPSVVDTTTTPPASTEGTTTTTTGVDEGAIDYKAELVKAQEQIKKAEHTIVDLKKSKEEGGQVDPSAVEEIRQSLSEEFDKKFEVAKLDLVKDAFEDELSLITSNPDERELIRLHYTNTIQKSGFDRRAIQGDLQRARLIANQPKIEKTVSELRQSAYSTKTTSGGSATGQRMETIVPSGVSPAEEQWAEQAARKTGKTKEEVIKQLLANRNKR